MNDGGSGYFTKIVPASFGWHFLPVAEFMT